jgi:hypothetical protein
MKSKCRSIKSGLDKPYSQRPIYNHLSFRKSVSNSQSRLNQPAKVKKERKILQSLKQIKKSPTHDDLYEDDENLFSISDDSDLENVGNTQKHTPIVAARYEPRQVVLETPFLTKNNITDSESDITLGVDFKLSQKLPEMSSNLLQEALVPFLRNQMKNSGKSNSSNRYAK